MEKYVFVYHGGPKFASPEEGRVHMQRWMAWMEVLGTAVIDRGLAVGKSCTAARNGISDNGGPNPISGFTVIQAENMDAALEMASKSPHVDAGGSIEVAPVMRMAM